MAKSPLASLRSPAILRAPAFLVLSAFLILPVSPAWALPARAVVHLLRASPAAGSKVRAPAHVVLRFSGPLEPAFSGALLLDRDGRNLSAAPVEVDGPLMTLTPGKLEPGTYRVFWHAVGNAGRRQDGQFRFTVRP